MLSVGIIGAGNAGTTIGAHFAIHHCSTGICDVAEERLEPIRAAGGFTLKGVSTTGFARFDLITNEISELVRGRKLIMVTAPSFAHRAVAEQMAPHLVDGQIILLNPGRTGGALEVDRIIREIRGDIDVLTAEAQTLVYACRITGEAEGTILEVKDELSLAALPARRNSEVLEIIAPFYPQFKPAGSVLETSLLNIGALFHPTPALLNIGRIEAGDDFAYYIEGITPIIGSFIEKLDAERIRVAKAMNVPTISVKEWLHRSYNIDHEPETSLFHMIQNTGGYQGIQAPKDPYHRYITEDVPMSLVPLAEFGKLVGVPTPVIDSVITLASELHGTDYRTKGRSLQSLGIAGLTMEELWHKVL